MFRVLGFRVWALQGDPLKKRLNTLYNPWARTSEPFPNSVGLRVNCKGGAWGPELSVEFRV